MVKDRLSIGPSLPLALRSAGCATRLKGRWDRRGTCLVAIAQLLRRFLSAPSRCSNSPGSLRPPAQVLTGTRWSPIARPKRLTHCDQTSRKSIVQIGTLNAQPRRMPAAGDPKARKREPFERVSICVFTLVSAVTMISILHLTASAAAKSPSLIPKTAPAMPTRMPRNSV